MPMYRRRRRVTRRGGYRATVRRGVRRSYRTRPRARRRTSRRRTSAQRIVIQVVGGPGAGAPVSAVTLGKKSARVVRRRY